MNIDFDQQILDGADKPMPKDKDSAEITTLGFVAATALWSPLPGDEKMEPVKKAQMGQLGLQVCKGGEQEVTPENIVLIRERTTRLFPSLICARVLELTGGTGAAGG